jgi:NAD(P)-dependent dehydrogenase (short-subunit alcohol dehydrogenase family)
MPEQESAIIVGAGPGLGAALGARFARGGYKVVLAARSADKLKPIIAEIGKSGGSAAANACDAANESDVKTLFGLVEQDVGPVAVVIYNAGSFAQSPIAEQSADAYEQTWRDNAFGGFLVGREAARRMLTRGRGTILFTGATASLRGAAGFSAFAGGKFALRALAQSLARELGPRGIHVGHVVIDGMIGRVADDRRLDPAAIAESYFALHAQPRSAWTFELDLRPWTEKF